MTSSSVAELHGRATANRLVLIGFVPLLVSLAAERRRACASCLAADGPGPAVGIRNGHERNAANLARRDPRLRHFDLPQRHDLQPTEGERGPSACCGCVPAIASVLSQMVDTLIFITVAFYGVFPIGELIVGQMLAKVVLSAVLVPPLVYAFVALGRGLDAGSD